MTRVSNILNSNNENTTVVKAIEVIDSTNSNEIEKKRLGLNLLMIGLSEIHAYRVSRLSSLLIRVEKELLNEQALTDLTPAKLYELHKLVNTSLTESVNFIQSTVRSVNWSDLELQLLELQNADAMMDEEEFLRRNSASQNANDIMRSVTDLLRTDVSRDIDANSLLTQDDDPEHDGERLTNTEYSIDDLDNMPDVNGSVILNDDIARMVQSQDSGSLTVQRYTAGLDDLEQDD